MGGGNIERYDKCFSLHCALVIPPPCILPLMCLAGLSHLSYLLLHHSGGVKTVQHFQDWLLVTDTVRPSAPVQRYDASPVMKPWVKDSYVVLCEMTGRGPYVELDTRSHISLFGPMDQIGRCVHGRLVIRPIAYIQIYKSRRKPTYS